MAKKEVIKRKKVKVAPDREEEIDVEEEVDEEEALPPVRKSVAEQAEEMRLASENCSACIGMAPRQCRAHRINLPI